jgi:hypothetical protein
MSRRLHLSLAICSYLANCTLGAGVASGVLDTRRIRWVHHALYTSTAVLTVSALAVLVATPGTRGAGLLLAPADVPLAAIPRVGRGRRHWVTALAAAPFYAAAAARLEATRGAV